MVVSIIIPACNEERVLGRLLDALDDPHLRRQLDVVVVCNGCTDGTVRVAEGHPLRPRVATLAEGSKHRALTEGDRLALAFPRFYVDADVEITAGDVMRLAEEFDGDVLAVAPERELRLPGSSWAVRAYYRVWERLPAVRDGLFGRGVLGVNEPGFERLVPRPAVLGDDLFVHSRFAKGERRIVPAAISIVYGPQRLSDLLRRRVRAARGNSELRERHTARATSSASLRDVVSSTLRHPTEAPATAVFLAVTLVARVMARYNPGSTAWLRDESSRTPATRPS